MKMSRTLYEVPSIQEDSITALSKKLLCVTEELTQSNLKLQQMQKERTDMLANLSHDLRAPVTAIRGAVDYLLEDPSSSEEERISVLQMIDRRTQVLETLIRNMYELFCAEGPGQELSLQTISAAPFLEEYFYSTILDSRYEDRQMDLKLQENLDCSLNIDVQRIIRVLDNLMTNAAKYSDPGSPIILSAKREHDCLSISVIDRGIGIPPESLDKIFGRTYTVSSARTPNSATGSGLGLSIAKAIIEKHHGTLTCQSVLGQGSTFTFSLPISEL